MPKLVNYDCITGDLIIIKHRLYKVIDTFSSFVVLSPLSNPRVRKPISYDNLLNLKAIYKEI